MDLNTLTYRELQGKAKEAGIPANKKKDELVRLLNEFYESSGDVEKMEAGLETEQEESSVPEAAIEAAEDESTIVEGLTEALSQIQLNKKIVFNYEENDNQAIKVDWGISSPIPPSYDENKNPQKMCSKSNTNTLTKPMTPVATKHIYFTSPELNVDKIRWEKDDDLENQTPKQKTTSDILNNQDQLCKSANRTDFLMSFWLSKGNTPHKLAKEFR